MFPLRDVCSHYVMCSQMYSYCYYTVTEKICICFCLDLKIFGYEVGYSNDYENIIKAQSKVYSFFYKLVWQNQKD